MKKKPGRPKVIGVKRPKLVKIYTSMLPDLRDEIDQAVTANGTRNQWIVDAIKAKLKKLAVKKKSTVV